MIGQAKCFSFLDFVLSTNKLIFFQFPGNKKGADWKKKKTYMTWLLETGNL